MGSMWIMLIAVACFLVAYLTYAKRLTNKWGIDNDQITPAHEKRDGVDYVPARRPILLGHHFASIAGAAPIIGPVTASEFGWFPVMLWIILGGIFIGAVHDMGSIFSSVRHGGRSIAQVIDKNVGRQGKQLFSIFAWLTLILIIAAFMNVVADAFVSTPEAATAELILIALAIAFGLMRQRGNVSMPVQIILGIAIVVVAVAIGLNIPLALPFNAWLWIFVIYTFIASVTPVWILLQPRDFLLSFLLYAILIGSFLGILVGNPGVELAGFTSFQTELGFMFPILFVTVACGAISGFHSLVSSGTTSKQLNRERDSKTVGYGGMLLECTLATIALLAAAVITGAEASALIAEGGPVLLFANGVGTFLGFLGIPAEVGVVFGTLTVAAFAMTTLDTATRLARYIFTEYFVPEEDEVGGEKQGIMGSRFFATAVSVLFAF